MALSKPLAYKINENTRRHTDFYDAAEPYRLFQKLRNEGIIELEEVDFYGGYRIPSDQFTPSSSEVNRELVVQRANDVRGRVQLNELLKIFKSGHICFIGPAGIGKSTLMKSIARNALTKECEGFEEIEVVHFVQCRHHQPGKLLTVDEFLFGADLDEEEIEMVINFTILHPNKILFVLDSLDTLQFSADGVYENVTIDEQAGPGAILWNFLSGKVLTGCRIITSSREHSIRNYMGEVRPQKIIALLGFNEKTIEKVVAEYVGEEEARRILAHLKENMPDMLILCSTPVILVYTLIGLQAESDLKPTTMTRIMVIVLQSIIRSPHMRHNHDVPGTMYKLEKLAHLGNMERRVLFYFVDFKNVGLEPEMATELAVIAPGGLPQKLMQGESVMFYTHQTIQEMLGTLWIAGRDVDVLSEFVGDCLDSHYFGVVRRFLYGILLDREVYNAASEDLLPVTDLDDENYEKKVALLKNDLKRRLESDLEPSDLLELMVSINEAKDELSDIIESSVDEVDLHGLPLSASDLHAVGSVISQSDKLENLDLHYQSLDSSALDILAKALKGTTMQLKRLYLSGNTNLGIDGIRAAEEIMAECQTEHLYLRLCKLSVEQLQTLVEILKKTPIKLLDITDHRNATHEDVCAVAHYLPNIKSDMAVFHWKIGEEDINYLQEKLDELDQANAPKVWLSAERILQSRTQKTTLTSGSGIPLSSTFEDHSIVRDSKQMTDAEITQEIEDSISRPISTAEIIGKAGGSVQLYGCELKFPPNALPEETPVGLTVLSTMDNVPPNLKSISPSLKCSTSNKFSGVVEIKLPIYCKVEDGQIVVLCKKKSRSGWQQVDATTVILGNTVTFQVSHFCWLRAFIRKIWQTLAPERLLLDNFVFSRKGSLYVLTCVQDTKVKEDSIREIKHGGYELALPLPEKAELRDEERMSYRFECPNPHDVIDPADEVYIACATIAHRKVEPKAFNINAAPESDDVQIRYILSRPNEEPKVSSFRIKCDEVNSRKQNAYVDVTAVVGNAMIRGSKRNDYEAHLRSNTIYRIDPHRRKGRVLIINNDFHGTRNGSLVDVENMEKLWKALGFDIVTKKNLNAQEMLQSCKNFAVDSMDTSVLVLIIMSHGGKEDGREYFTGEDHQKLSVDEVISIFTFTGSPQLQGIPKVLMFQACRGSGENFIWTCDQQDQADADTEGLPDRADILITYPTQEGFKALRNRAEGSWLINAISHVFTEHAHHKHILDMLTIVNKGVAKRSTRTQRVQASNQLSYLTKDIYLFPGWPQALQQ